MKKITLSILGSLLILFIIVTLFNTLTLKTRQPDPKPFTATINEAHAVNTLSKAIQFKTISYQDRTKMNLIEFDRFISFLEQSYPVAHDQLELEKVNDYALVYKWKGTNPDKPPIGLTSHYDVVPVLDGTEDKWEHAPFSGNIADG